MKMVHKQISIEELKRMSEGMLGNLVKAVVDIEKGIMIVDAELHADEEYVLLEKGSKQEHLWGINIYPACLNKEDFIEFDSMINLRPSWGNKSRRVEDPAIQKKIIDIVDKLITR